MLSAASTTEHGEYFTCIHLRKSKSFFYYFFKRKVITKHVNFQSSRLLGKLKLDLAMINLKLLLQSVRPALIIVTYSRKDILRVVRVSRCWSHFWAKAAL